MVDDAQGRAVATDDIDVIVLPVNDSPVLTAISNQETNEDAPLVLTLEATDADEDELTFDATSSSPSDVSAEVSGDQLTLTPAEDFNGDVQINVSVTDGEYSDTEVFTLIVFPMNDAPTIDLPASVTFDEDGSYTEDFSVYIDDIDEDELSLSVTGGENVLVEINGSTVIFTSNADWNGTETLTFMVDDAQGRAVATDDIDVVVLPVNDAPVSNDISIVIPEDSSVLIEVSGEDIEGDSLSFEVVDLPQHGGLGPSFVVSIDAEGEGQTHSLNLGFLPFATDIYDDGIDIYAPPAPPPPAFDAALSWNGDRYYTQMINGSPDDLVEHVWDIQLQYGVDGEILLSWDPSSLDDSGSFILEDAFGGMMFSVDMSTQSEFLLDNPAFTT